MYSIFLHTMEKLSACLLSSDLKHARLAISEVIYIRTAEENDPSNKQKNDEN